MVVILFLLSLDTHGICIIVQTLMTMIVCWLLAVPKKLDTHGDTSYSIYKAASSTEVLPLHLYTATFLLDSNHCLVKYCSQTALMREADVCILGKLVEKKEQKMGKDKAVPSLYFLPSRSHVFFLANKLCSMLDNLVTLYSMSSGRTHKVANRESMKVNNTLL